MQRSKIEALADYFLNVIVYNDGVAVLGTSVQNAVTDCCDLISALDHAVLCILKSIHNHLDCYGVGRHVFLYDIFVLASRLMGQFGTLDTNSLAQTLCDYALIGHVDQLIF